jgi:hypothetical protein
LLFLFLLCFFLVVLFSFRPLTCGVAGVLGAGY